VKIGDRESQQSVGEKNLRAVIPVQLAGLKMKTRRKRKSSAVFKKMIF
jgi:hypothetical protein